MDDLKLIKEYYGEEMMHLCRKLFPTILEKKGKLLEIIESNFAHSKLLYDDIIKNNLKSQFDNFINQQFEKEQKNMETTNKTPQELMKMAGYELYECHTEEDIQKFRKYYKPDEEICTFKGRRLDTCYVFFAVKYNAEELKREDFKNPKREDEYGISVISIQFSIDNHRLSIKNRYNDTVINPDATYKNNLENIIPGLTESFERTYGYNIKQSNEGNFKIPGYIKVNGKFYKYNYEINKIYYCPNNVIIKNGEIKEYPKERYIIFDYFILDLKKKEFIKIDEKLKDGFLQEYKDIENIEIEKGINKKIIITQHGKKSIITINNQNQIIEYENNELKATQEKFMTYNKTLKKLTLENLETMGSYSFNQNENIEELKIQKLKKMGNYCFHDNINLKKLNLQNLIIMGESCFAANTIIEELNLENVMVLGDGCFFGNTRLQYLILPNLEIMGAECFYYNETIKVIYAPKEKIMGDSCFVFNKNLEKIYLGTIIEIGDYCFYKGTKIKKIFMPNVEKLGENCFVETESLEELYVPNLREIGIKCFYSSKKLKKLKAQNLKKIKIGCFELAELEEIYAPNLEECDNRIICDLLKTLQTKKLKKKRYLTYQLL